MKKKVKTNRIVFARLVTCTCDMLPEYMPGFTVHKVNILMIIGVVISFLFIYPMKLR